jgi:hypothetical protein
MLYKSIGSQLILIVQEKISKLKQTVLPNRVKMGIPMEYTYFPNGSSAFLIGLNVHLFRYRSNIVNLITYTCTHVKVHTLQSYTCYLHYKAVTHKALSTSFLISFKREIKSPTGWYSRSQF